MPSNVDAVFQGYRQKLPEPATLSEQNGHTLECDRHGWATMTLLRACAAKVPIAQDRDLPALIPWLRDSDKCIRYIAMEVLIPKIGFDRNQLSVPGMFDPEHWQFHDIFVAFKSYLDTHRVAYEKAAFEGLFLTVSQNEFSSLIHGKWAEDTEGHKFNFEQSIELDAESVKLVQKEMNNDPKWPLHTWTTRIKSVRLGGRGQFVLTGEWDVESNANGYRGPQQASQFVYTFWLVKKGVLWFSEQHNPHSWKKFRKVQ